MQFRLPQPADTIDPVEQLVDLTDGPPAPIKFWFVFLFALAGLVSAVLLPIPGWLLLRSGLLGAVVGALFALRVTVVAWIGAAVMMLFSPGLYHAAYRRAIDTGQAWPSRFDWQIPLVTWGVVGLLASMPTLIRRFRQSHAGA